ncbi:hypothetical protein D3C76_1408530 [compost metagenome]
MEVPCELAKKLPFGQIRPFREHIQIERLLKVFLQIRNGLGDSQRFILRPLVVRHIITGEHTHECRKVGADQHSVTFWPLIVLIQNNIQKTGDLPQLFIIQGKHSFEVHFLPVERLEIK